MDANLLIKTFKEKIKKDVEQSGLPSGVCMYIIKDVAQELEGLYNQHCAVASFKVMQEAEKKEAERKQGENSE